MTATTSQPTTAPIVPPETAGECLTWQQIKNLQPDVFLFGECFTGKTGVFCTIGWVDAASSLIQGGIHLKELTDPKANGECNTREEYMPPAKLLYTLSKFRLATEAEIKQAEIDHANAWGKAIEEQEAFLAKSKLAWMLRCRELGIAFLAPPPREPTE